ncbi:MAG TPA: RdgB/HAM1 family non-canonical purine NTP pyrophosphatase [Candidatus Angelobacter sp.]|nr:RdgB/HAM1 family non-canonical purine NTP pyrophosphatase [Candidatus Angelobacter sp.]
MPKIYIATSNPGKLREFRDAAAGLGVVLDSLPGIDTVAQPVEDGATFADNARIKAEYYSRLAPDDFVLAEDSGLAVDELDGAPGVYSARYAAMLREGGNHAAHSNSSDDENNQALIARLERLPPGKHAGKYVCVIALAQREKALNTFLGEAKGELLTTPRGSGGFGYDPLFYFPSLGRTFAELSLQQKRQYSHRGQAFRSFLSWYGQYRNS